MAPAGQKARGVSRQGSSARSMSPLARVRASSSSRSSASAGPSGAGAGTTGTSSSSRPRLRDPGDTTSLLWEGEGGTRTSKAHLSPPVRSSVRSAGAGATAAATGHAKGGSPRQRAASLLASHHSSHPDHQLAAAAPGQLPRFSTSNPRRRSSQSSSQSSSHSGSSSSSRRASRGGGGCCCCWPSPSPGPSSTSTPCLLLCGGRGPLLWVLTVSLLFASALLLESSARLPSFSAGVQERLFRGRGSLASATLLGLSLSNPFPSPLKRAPAPCPKASAAGTDASARRGGGAEAGQVVEGMGRAIAGAVAAAGASAGGVGAQGGVGRGRHLTAETAAASVASLKGLPNITIFSTPYPFSTDLADPQLTALRSWLALPPSVKVVLIGQDESLGRVAAMFPGGRVAVETGVACDFFGLPLLNAVLDYVHRRRAEEVAQQRRQWTEEYCRSVSQDSGAGVGAGQAEGGEETAEGGAVSPAKRRSAQCTPPPESVPSFVPSVSVLLSPDALLTADLLPAVMKLDQASHQWAAMAATWQLQEDQGVAPELLHPIPSSPVGAEAGQEGGSAGVDPQRDVGSFVKAQEDLRGHARRRGELDPFGKIDLFAWGGAGWGPDLVPRQWAVPPLSLGMSNVSRWLAGALATAEGITRVGPAGEEPAELQGANSTRRVLVVDVTDSVTVAHVSPREWAKRVIPRGRQWPTRGRKRKSRQLGLWQSLRTEYLLSSLAVAASQRLATDPSGAKFGLRRRTREVPGTPPGEGQAAPLPLPGSPHWTEVMYGSPLLAPYELASCAEAHANHLCLKPRVSPGRCRCANSVYSRASLGDEYPSPSGKQWFCGRNLLREDPPSPLALVTPFQRPGRRRRVPKLSLPPGMVAMEEILPFVALKTPDGARLVVLVGITGQYNPMLLNFVCNLRRLGLASHLVVAAMDLEAYTYAMAHGLPVYYEGFQALEAAEGAQKKAEGVGGAEGEGCKYGTDCFKALTKVKSKTVLRVLKAGYDVLWTDVDIVWFADPLPELLKYERGQLPIQSNEPLPRRKSRINSGFYLARADRLTLEAFEGIVAHAAKSKKSEQPSFNEVLCGEQGPYKVKGKPECKHPNGLRTMFLDRKRFANGAIFDIWASPNVTRRCAREGCTILHNNWITGKDSKERRFVKKGFWHYDVQRQVCSPEPLLSMARTIAPTPPGEEEGAPQTPEAATE